MKSTFFFSALLYLGLFFNCTQASPMNYHSEEVSDHLGNSSPSEQDAAYRGRPRFNLNDLYQTGHERSLAEFHLMESERAGYKSKGPDPNSHEHAPEIRNQRMKNQQLQYGQRFHAYDPSYEYGAHMYGQGPEYGVPMYGASHPYGDYSGTHQDGSYSPQAHQSRYDRLRAERQKMGEKAKAKLHEAGKKAEHARQSMASNSPSKHKNSHSSYNSVYYYGNGSRRSSSSSEGRSPRYLDEDNLGLAGNAIYAGVAGGEILDAVVHGTPPSSPKMSGSWWCGLGWCEGDGSSSPHVDIPSIPHVDIPSIPETSIPAPNVTLDPSDSGCGECIGGCIGACCEAMLDSICK